MSAAEASARTTRRDSLENRQSILDSARQVLALDPNASLSAIASAAGLSRRALYGHFEDRDSLLRELIATGAERFNDIARTVTDDDPRLALARLASLLWREAVHMQLSSAIALDDSHIDDTAMALAPLRRRVMQIVRDGQDRDVLRTDVTAPTLARLVEEAARSVIAQIDGSSPAARALAVKSVMSIAGLSWRESVALIEQHPDLISDQGARS